MPAPHEWDDGGCTARVRVAPMRGAGGMAGADSLRRCSRVATHRDYNGKPYCRQHAAVHAADPKLIAKGTI